MLSACPSRQDYCVHLRVMAPRVVVRGSHRDYRSMGSLSGALWASDGTCFDGPWRICDLQDQRTNHFLGLRHCLSRGAFWSLLPDMVCSEIEMVSSIPLILKPNRVAAAPAPPAQSDGSGAIVSRLFWQTGRFRRRSLNLAYAIL